MRIALPFHDDSGLIFAVKIGRELERRGHVPVYIHIHEARVPDSKLSARQIALSLGKRGVDASVAEKDFISDAVLASFQAVIASRVVAPVQKALANPVFRNRRDRPRFVGFMAGLDFRPENGVANRLWFDAVFLNTPADRDLFRSKTRRGDDQHVSYGHPYYIRPERLRAPAGNAPIYFFAQAISPQTLGGRLHMLHLLYALAHKYPERRIVIKLRHLPEENRLHQHKELFSYPWIMERFAPPPPPNLVFDASSMEAALADAGYAITCTSTAAMDAVSAGVPTFVYLDYVENYMDPLCEPMRKLCGPGDLVRPLRDIMALQVRAPNLTWVNSIFRGPDLYDELIAVMQNSTSAAVA